MLLYFEDGVKSFHTYNIGSIGQRAAKLLAVNVGGLKKVCHPAPVPVEPVGPDSILDEVESYSKFDGL